MRSSPPQLHAYMSTSGLCTSSPTTVAECEAAARFIGLSDSFVNEQVYTIEICTSRAPPGCLYQPESFFNNALRFNEDLDTRLES